MNRKAIFAIFVLVVMLGVTAGTTYRRGARGTKKVYSAQIASTGVDNNMAGLTHILIYVTRGSPDSLESVVKVFSRDCDGGDESFIISSWMPVFDEYFPSGIDSIDVTTLAGSTELAWRASN